MWVHRTDAFVHVGTYSTYKCCFDLIGPCCSQERTGRAASVASCFGSWRSLCPGRGGRRGRCTPSLGRTAGDKSVERQREEQQREIQAQVPGTQLGKSGDRNELEHTLQTLCEHAVVIGWNASSWQHTHMKICSILRRKFFTQMEKDGKT